MVIYDHYSHVHGLALRPRSAAPQQATPNPHHPHISRPPLLVAQSSLRRRSQDATHHGDSLMDGKSATPATTINRTTIPAAAAHATDVIPRATRTAALNSRNTTFPSRGHQIHRERQMVGVHCKRTQHARERDPSRRPAPRLHPRQLALRSLGPTIPAIRLQ